MSEKQGKYYLYQVTENTTLTALVNEKDSVFQFYKNKIHDLLLVKYDGKTNADRIYSNYTQGEVVNQTTNFKYANSNSLFPILQDFLDVVYVGTELALPEDKTPVELFSIAGKGLFLEQKDVKLFLTEAFKKINNDPQNTPTVVLENGFDTTQIKDYSVSVWIYSKALDKIIDVTKFLSNLNTTSNVSGGGNFNISLEGVSDIKDSFGEGEDIVNIYKIEDFYDRNINQMSYFSRWFQQKDIVWIRWEKLELEENRPSVTNGFEVDKSKLSKQIYDMIGLVSDINETTSFSSTDRTVSISGGDLMTLLSEDAAYFYPLLFAQGSDAVLYNTQDNSKLFKRNIFKDGIFEDFFTFMERSVSDSIGFVVNQLSNLGIVDKSLFSGYTENNEMKGDRLSKARKQALTFTGTGKENAAYISWQDVEGIWQIIDIFVDKQLDRRRQVDSLLQTSQGSILSMMNSICQDPFVEFIGDTYGDKYVFFARQKIWTKSAIQGFLEGNVVLNIEGKDVLNQSLDWETEYFTSYEIQPNSSFLGYDKFTALSYIPVVFLSKIGEVFGNRPYVQADSYIDEVALTGDKKEIIPPKVPLRDGVVATEDGDVYINPFRRAVIDDLGYLIEINSYLPFTRKGTIVINGDRRIKKGTWIRYKPTGEIFYVTSVSNSGSWSKNSVDRTTTITVERGMVEYFVYRRPVKSKTGKTIMVSYFDIVDSELVKTVMKEILIDGKIPEESKVKEGNNVVQNKIKEETKASFDVNLDVFDFFLKRGQFRDKNETTALVSDENYA